MAPPKTAPVPRISNAHAEDAQTIALAEGVQAAPPPDDGVEKVAVIVTHGMGQQVPFETLEMVANAVLREHKLQNPKAPEPKVVTRVVRMGTEGNPVELQLPRAEMRLTLPGGTHRDVHFYEVYWAPLTEGKVTISDVIKFLLSAGWLGITNTFQGRYFERWMFGSFQRFVKRTWRLFLSFLLAIAELISLVLVNGIIAAVATSKLLTAGKSDWPSHELRTALTFDMLCVVTALGMVAVGIFLISRWVRYLAWTFVWAGLFGLPVSATLMGLHVLFPSTLPEMLPSILGSKYVLLILWGLSLLASNKVRTVLVQYVGDVAAYVSSYTVSKFWEVRKQIYETSSQVFGGVYKSRREETIIYDWKRYSLDGQSRPRPSASIVSNMRRFLSLAIRWGRSFPTIRSMGCSLKMSSPARRYMSHNEHSFC